MKIKLTKVAYVHTNNMEFKKFLRDNAGKWVEVDTTYLFSNQFNLKEQPYRILEVMIDDIQGDIRKQGDTRCNYCGKINCKEHEARYQKALNSQLFSLPNYKEILAIKDFSKMDINEKKFNNKGYFPNRINLKGSKTYIESMNSLGWYRLHYGREIFDFLYNPDTKEFLSKGIGWRNDEMLNAITSEKTRQAIKEAMEHVYSQK